MDVIQQNSVFIDPEECGSSVGYFIKTYDYENSKTHKVVHSLSATIVLADCSHKIDWYFSEDSLKKIDTVIRMLKEFRALYAVAAKRTAALNKEGGENG